MQTIVIVLDPTKLDNPDLDLRYLVPDRVEAVTHLRTTAMIIWTPPLRPVWAFGWIQNLPPKDGPRC